MVKATSTTALKEMRMKAESEIVALRIETGLQLKELNLKMGGLVAEVTHLKTNGRPEDTVKICSLERQLSDTKQNEKKLKDEAVFYKRELHNREENFNSRFTGTSNANVNVGIMTVFRKGMPVGKGKENKVTRARLHVKDKTAVR